ncbi:MAG: endopeptidase La [Clostridia bacterium]|nr:endopeptidase La [Clostridia bacterium]
MNENNEPRIIRDIPMIALRGMVMFPKTVMHFDVARDVSLAALNYAMEHDCDIFLVAQRDITVDAPNEKQLYAVGCIARIKQILKNPEGGIRAVAAGFSRAELCGITVRKPFLRADVALCETKPVRSSAVRVEALRRSAMELFEEYSELVPRMAPDLYMNAVATTDVGELADFFGEYLYFKYEDRQTILDELDPVKRIKRVVAIFEKEIDILELENDIHFRVKEQIDKNNREYYIREQIRVLNSELDEDEDLDECDAYEDKIKALKLSAENEEHLMKEVDRLRKMPVGSHEGTVVRTYLDTVIDLPWNTFTKEKNDLAAAKKQLDKDHWGLDKIKERILEFLAVKQLAPDIKGQTICLVGPPGVGKTSLAKSIAKTLNRKYARISLGGVRDDADIRGHRKTYIGSMPGRIMNAVKLAGSSNALILLDEVDKLCSDFRGDPAAALLEVLDAEQNNAYRDHYIELPFDLSNVMFITTANTTDSIPAPLLDRMELIELDSYTREEKLNIAKKHLLPKQMKRHGLSRSVFSVTDGAILEIIDFYTREAGVREVERELAAVCRKAAKEYLENGKRIKVDEKAVGRYLGVRKFRESDFASEGAVGTVNGLAWTSVGGVLLPVEVSALDGSGKLELTGQLGDVMKESARTAVSFIRSRCDALGIDKDFYKTKDIHIHAPEGAVPKDGPSAGITIALALASALSGRKVAGGIAMTGEITLRGRVLQIGGLKEKSMAAYRHGIKRVIIPKENLPDLEDISKTVREATEFIPVSHMDEVLALALEKDVGE